MRSREPYTPCKLYYDGRHVEVGDYLRTPGGSVYLIQSVRPSPSRAGRRNLSCVRWPADQIPDGATVHPLHWYKRTKKRATTLEQLQR